VRKEELQDDVIQRGWICDSCAEKKIRLQVLHFIANRIQATQTVPRDKYKFIFRELLQNADDVRANILVLVFEQDALYVANDGRAFTVRSVGNIKSDFDRLSQILGRHQEEDKEVVGHFGSGFQTVYAITNYPEVYSSGRSGRMNPCREKWMWGIKSPHVHFKKSPYWRQKDNKGALFRFPWRDDKAAEEEVDGEKVWEDRNKWPRWDRQERRKMFDDLRRYIHQAILCCQHLRAVRLVWHEKGSFEGFQVLRSFLLRNKDAETLKMDCFIGSVRQGSIEFEASGISQWDSIFQIEDGWRWGPDSCSFDYLIGERNLNEDGKRLFLCKQNSSVVVTSDKAALEKELERGDLFVLIPLFDVASLFELEGVAYLYSVIPLPGLGKNKFIFSAHFWPTEDRKDVDVEGGNGEFGKWYRSIMLNVLELYQWLFDRFLAEIHKVDMPEEVRQKIILNAVPVTLVSEWMRPGKEDQVEWVQRSSVRFYKLVSFLVEKSILFSSGKWCEPAKAYWAKDNEEKTVFEILGTTTFTYEFINHPQMKILLEALNDRKVDEGKFNALWGTFFNVNRKASGSLVYGQDLSDGKKLDKKAMDSLIEFCITRPHFVSSLKKEVVPGRDGILRGLEEYPVLPLELQFLFDFLPGSKTIHDDFRTKDLERVRQDKILPWQSDRIIYLIDEVVKSDFARFENLGEKDHLVLSRVIKILVDKMSWVPRDGLKACRFVPYRQGHTVSLGTLNVSRGRGETRWVSSQSTREHVERYYERDFIFGIQTLKVPGLTSEVQAKIKFLLLLDCDDKTVEKIESALSLVKLMAQEGKPLNFVLHFLSPQHESLFVDFVLQSFLGFNNEKELSNMLANQKKQFQEALKVYFKEEHTGEEYLTRKDMAKVPCLYDEKGDWFNAGEFALTMEPKLKMLGYKSLHEDLRKWPPKTLSALGVDSSPSFSRIVETVKELAGKKEEHREDLGNIISWLLISEVHISDEFGNLAQEGQDLLHLSWIPTVDGSFKRPKEVLLPSLRNMKILGDDFGGFLEYFSFKNKLNEESGEWQRVTKRAESLGLNVVPKLFDMLSVVRMRREADSPPPTGLFDALSKKVVSDEQEAENLIGAQNFGYYLSDKEKWIDSNRIRIIDEKEVPKEIRDILTILSIRNPHSHYLMLDGATDELLPEDILQPLLDKRVAPSENIWDELSKLNLEFEEDLKQVYGGKLIYPIGDSLVSPESVICIENDEDEGFLKEGSIGKWHILGRLRTQKHGQTLRALGARGGLELGRSEILDLLKSEKNLKPTLTLDEASIVLRLIDRLRTLNSNLPFPEDALWPAEKASQIIWMRPKLCLIKDSPLSKIFENDLCFICLKIDGEMKMSLREYAIASGCEEFTDCLKREGKIETEDCAIDTQATNFYKELANALGQYFVSYRDSGCFEWLKNVEGKSCDRISVKYSTVGFEKMVERAALVECQESRCVVSRRRISSRAVLFDQLEEEIANVCIEKGFPDSERENLQSIIYKLLTRKIEEWSDIVEDYRQGSIASPIPVIEPVHDSDAFPTLEEVLSLNSMEMNEAGYSDTKTTLQSWYQACQICGNRTPSDENGYTTSETLKRVVCSKGGRYKGNTSGFSTSNSVLLCPTHQVLWVRGLVRFSDIENPSNETVKRLEERIGEKEKLATENPQQLVSWKCQVFEGKPEPGKVGSKGSWKEKDIEFRVEHLVGFLKTLYDYLGERDFKESHVRGQRGA
jgi:hypothetical protein